MTELEVREFLDLAKTLPVIDVRSPGEFQQGHIPFAYNIPLFDDDERAIIGTTYKSKGKKEAVLEGFEIVGPKIASFIRTVQTIAVGDEVLVHCWRGGMRSGSFSWMLNTAGIAAHTLKGGYKNYRNFALEFFSNPGNLILLGGETGSGKTEILNALAEAGEQIIDLESLAQHKGSSFGGLSGNTQPSNEQFQNNLLKEFLGMDPMHRIWLEDESHHIGAVRVPDVLWLKMRAAHVIRLIVPKDVRINRLVKQYSTLEKDLLKDGLSRIRKKLGGLNTKLAMEALDVANFGEVAALCLTYYDKAYKTGLRHRDEALIHNLEVAIDETNIAGLVQAFADKIVQPTFDKV